MAEPYHSWTDEDLALACKKHNEQAFAELMKRYVKQIYNFSRQYIRTSEDAEDVAQDTFFKVWKYIGQYSAGRKFRPWLFTIARNTALDFIKKKKALSFSDLDDDENDLRFADTLEDTEPLAPELFEAAEISGKLTAILEQIHPEHRAVLMMHYREGMTFEEIAVVVGKPMNTLKSWHRRALIKLKSLLGNDV